MVTRIIAEQAARRAVRTTSEAVSGSLGMRRRAAPKANSAMRSMEDAQ